MGGLSGLKVMYEGKELAVKDFKIDMIQGALRNFSINATEYYKPEPWEVGFSNKSTSKIVMHHVPGQTNHHFNTGWSNQYGDSATMTVRADQLKGFNLSKEEEKNMSVSARDIARLDLSEDDRLLIDEDIMDSEGELTENGRDVMLNILFKDNKTKVVRLVREVADSKFEDEE